MRSLGPYNVSVSQDGCVGSTLNISRKERERRSKSESDGMVLNLIEVNKVVVYMMWN